MFNHISSEQWLKWFSNKRTILGVFRSIAFLIAATLMIIFPGDFRYHVSPYPLIVGAGLYTIFKLAHPLTWHTWWRSNLALLTLDMSIGLTLMGLTGGINSPFLFYSLVPVLTSSLLLAPAATALVTVITGITVIIMAFTSPLFARVEIVEHLSLSAIYLVSLLLLSALPYAFNSVAWRRKWFSSVMQERTRLGRELHDGLCQTICGLQWEVQRLKRIINNETHSSTQMDELESLLEQAEKDARDAITALRDYGDDRAISEQLRDYLDELAKETNIKMSLEEKGEELCTDEYVKSELLHVCREALMNILKHARATKVNVLVERHSRDISIRIVDDGQGMETPEFNSGHGLSVMRERIELLGGTFSISSAPGQGTAVEFEVQKVCTEEIPAG